MRSAATIVLSLCTLAPAGYAADVVIDRDVSIDDLLAGSVSGAPPFTLAPGLQIDVAAGGVLLPFGVQGDTVDLGGAALTVLDGGVLGSISDPLNANTGFDNADLTFQTGSAAGFLTIGDNSSLTVNGGNLTIFDEIGPGSSVTINGGEVSSFNLLTPRGDTDVTLNGGTLRGGLSLISGSTFPNSGTFTMTGGTLDGRLLLGSAGNFLPEPISNSSGTISGGHVTGNVSLSSQAANNDGVFESIGTTLTVSGGTFDGLFEVESGSTLQFVVLEASLGGIGFDLGVGDRVVIQERGLLDLELVLADGSDLTLTLSAVPTVNTQEGWDGISVFANLVLIGAVPTPAGASLMGVAGLLASRRRR